MGSYKNLIQEYLSYMLTVRRQDSVSLMTSRRTPEGFLEAPAFVAKEGLLTYYQDGKPFVEYVPAKTLEDPEHLAGLAGLPVTKRHPREARVDASNALGQIRGTTTMPGSMVEEGGDKFAQTKVRIMDADLVDDVEQGTQELSLGYTAILDKRPGTWRGMHYDAVQVKRTNNHLAVVPRARAGNKVRLRLDSADNLIEEEEMELVTINIDGKDIQVSKEAAAVIEAGLKAKTSTTRTDSADTAELALKLAEAQRKADTAQGELDQIKKKETAANSEQAKADEAKRIDGLVKERASLLTSAKNALPEAEHAKLDALDSLGIMKLVLVTLDPETKLDGLSEDYVRGAFGAALKSGKKAETKKDSALGNLMVHGPKGNKGTSENGTKVVNVDEAINHRRRNISDRWKTPVKA